MYPPNRRQERKGKELIGRIASNKLKYKMVEISLNISLIAANINKLDAC